MSGTDAPLEPLADLRGVAILVVDDDPDTCAMLDAALQAAGATVHSSTSALEALRVLRGQVDPRVILTDLVMPGQDGVWLTRQVRATRRRRKLPVIGITARPLRRLPTAWTEVGFAAVLAKPIDPIDLATVILAHARPRAADAVADAPDAAARSRPFRPGDTVRHVAYPWMGEVVDSAHEGDGYVLVRWRTGSPMRLEAQERVECVVHLPVIRGGAAVDASRAARYRTVAQTLRSTQLIDDAAADSVRTARGGRPVIGAPTGTPPAPPIAGARSWRRRAGRR